MRLRAVHMRSTLCLLGSDMWLLYTILPNSFCAQHLALVSGQLKKP